MMPLSMLSVGSTDTIKKITGKDEVRRFLSSLGLVEGRACDSCFGDPMEI